MKFYFLIVLMLISLKGTAKEFQITSYNLGLAETFVPYARERFPVLVDELKRHQTDFLCIQEIWRESDKINLSDALKNEYPYSYFTKPQNKFSNKAPACNPWHLFGPKSVGLCFVKNCIRSVGDKLTQCVVDNCQSELSGLSQNHKECAQGLMAAVGKEPFKFFLKLINPFEKAPLFAYEGDNGLLVLSKHKILATNLLDYSHFSTVNRRSSLVVDLDIANKRTIIACSHLAAQLSDVIPYPGENQNWETDNKLQIEALLKYMESKDAIKVLAGDFNCSVAKSSMSVTSEFESNCRIFSDQGYLDHFQDNVASCTYCNSNRIIALNKKDSLDGGPQLDHIFTKGVEVTKSSIEFTAPVMIQLEGKATMFHPSDHFGVKQVLNFPE